MIDSWEKALALLDLLSGKLKEKIVEKGAENWKAYQAVTSLNVHYEKKKSTQLKCVTYQHFRRKRQWSLVNRSVCNKMSFCCLLHVARIPLKCIYYFVLDIDFPAGSSRRFKGTLSWRTGCHHEIHVSYGKASDHDNSVQMLLTVIIIHCSHHLSSHWLKAYR